MTRYSAGALSGTGSVGSASLDAAATSAPYASLRPSGCSACADSVFTSAKGMPHSAAAAWRMSQRPCAPNWRSSAQPSGMLVLPPAPCAPQRQRGSAPLKSMDMGICSTVTCDQSASSSSARIIGSDVLTPCPISAPVAPITMRLSGSMRIRHAERILRRAGRRILPRRQSRRQDERARRRQRGLQEQPARDHRSQRVHFEALMSRAARAMARRMRT